jgi:ABC-type transport system involved in multi-copper enzyme maturation permease subunit
MNSFLFTEVTVTTMDRILKDTGIAAINVFALALTLFIGVGIINREIDRRSIYAVIPKPIARVEFILGKYLGLLEIMLVTCGAMFAGLILVIKGYHTPIHPALFVGFLGIFLEVAVLGAFAVLCSSFTSSLVSAFLCAAIFISGHLSPELKFFAKKSHSAFIKAMGNAIYYTVPNLERFNFKYEVTYDRLIPGSTLAPVVLYALMYTAAFLMAASVIFSNRDFR